MTKGFFNKQELAEYLGVSLRFIVKHDSEARPIPGRTKIGSMVRYRISDVERALSRPEGLFGRSAKK